MDWTLEDIMANGFTFCATITNHRSGHTPFVQTRTEMSDTGTQAVEPDPSCHWRSQEFCPGDQSPDVRPIIPSVYFRKLKIGIKHQ